MVALRIAALVGLCLIWSGIALAAHSLMGGGFLGFIAWSGTLLIGAGVVAVVAKLTEDPS